MLDNQSTVDLFYNPELLTNIHTVNERIYIHCNAGTQWTNQQGDLPGYGRVWYCPSAIANILSLHNVQNRCRVEYDSTAGNRFVVTRSDGTERVFSMSDTGLYFYDTATSAWASSSQINAVLVNTVSDNKTRYTNAEVSRAEVARALQRKIGRPTTRDFIHIVNHNLLPNCPVTQRDIMAAEDIFGPDLGSLKGKTVRRRPHSVTTDITYSPLPPTVHERYQAVTLCADVMHVNGIPFFVSISRHLKFGTVEALPNQHMTTIVKCVRNIARVYHRGGFRLRHSLMDGAFKSIRGDLLGMGILLNPTSREEHVGDIERYIRTVKERMRCSYNTVPFARVPPRMVVELASREVFWLNAFPPRGGISTTLSPRAIVTGQTVHHDRHCKYEFGQYVQTHEPHDNTMAPRTVGAIALRPTGNAQGSYYFFSLDSGRVINRLHATPLPMPNEVKDRVLLLARRQKANPGLIFLDRHRQPFDDDMDDDASDHGPDDEDDDDGTDDDDSSYHPDDTSDAFDSDDDDADDANDYPDYAENTGVEDADDDDEQTPGVDDDDDDEPTTGVEDDTTDAAHDDDFSDDDALHPALPDDGEIPGVPPADDIADVTSLRHDDVPDVTPVRHDDVTTAAARLADDMDTRYGPRSGAHHLRPRKPPSFAHLHTVAHTDPADTLPSDTARHSANVHETGPQRVWCRRSCGCPQGNATITRPQGHGCQEIARYDPARKEGSPCLLHVP